MGNGFQPLCWFNVGDQSGPKQEVQVACTPVFELAGFAAYHSSIVLGRVEYHFGPSGVVQCPTRASSTGLSTHTSLPSLGGGILSSPGGGTQVITVGQSTRNGREMLEALVPHFQAGTYDLCIKNCNTFTDIALYFLLGERLGKHYTKFERTVAAASPTLLSLLERLMDEEKDPMLRYLDNPLAKDFCTEDVLAAVDSHLAILQALRAKGKYTWCQSQQACRTCACGPESEFASANPITVLVDQKSCQQMDTVTEFLDDTPMPMQGHTPVPIELKTHQPSA